MFEVVLVIGNIRGIVFMVGIAQRCDIVRGYLF